MTKRREARFRAPPWGSSFQLYLLRCIPAAIRDPPHFHDIADHRIADSEVLHGNPAIWIPALFGRMTRLKRLRTVQPLIYGLFHCDSHTFSRSLVGPPGFGSTSSVRAGHRSMLNTTMEPYSFLSGRSAPAFERYIPDLGKLVPQIRHETNIQHNTVLLFAAVFYPSLSLLQFYHYAAQISVTAYTVL